MTYNLRNKKPYASGYVRGRYYEIWIDDDEFDDDDEQDEDTEDRDDND